MKQQNSKWMLFVLSATATFLVQPLRAEVLEKSKQVNDTIVHAKSFFPTTTIRSRYIQPFWRLAAGPRR
jgi:hypothetical protein